MALLTITINDPGLQKKSAEVAFALKALGHVETELGRGNGSATSGTVTGQNASGATVSLGSWTYTPSATLP
jgi:hypothetical protein